MRFFQIKNRVQLHLLKNQDTVLYIAYCIEAIMSRYVSYHGVGVTPLTYSVPANQSKMFIFLSLAHLRQYLGRIAETARED